MESIGLSCCEYNSVNRLTTIQDIKHTYTHQSNISIIIQSLKSRFSVLNYTGRKWVMK